MAHTKTKSPLIENRQPRPLNTLVPGRPSQVNQPFGPLSFASRRSKGRNALQLLRDIRDYNPDAALAIWNVLRLANPGFELRVLQLEKGPDGESALHDEAREVLDELLGRAMSEYGGGLDVLIDLFNLTLMTQGATAGELDLSDDTTEVLVAVIPSGA